MATAPDYEALDRPFIHPNDMPDLHALRAYGTCMEPLLSDGSVLAFDKRETPEIGDIVSLIFTQEAAERWKLPGLVKKLALPLPPLNGHGEAVGLIVVDQFNPPRRYCIPTTDILAVHKFVGVAESTGPGMARYRPQAKGA